ncbi:hypothetical protein LSCM4_03286 [Leishmania orientalis]|uniref:Uncharacterized protein n=1 Tax=Leishmania orientalis TaxID=2249476 RepID=A0A836GDY9_9TRYP|nr:hypothetical protein LSCM4_03286 [Leishmania orientalis]
MHRPSFSFGCLLCLAYPLRPLRSSRAAPARGVGGTRACAGSRSTLRLSTKRISASGTSGNTTAIIVFVVVGIDRDPNTSLNEPCDSVVIPDAGGCMPLLPEKMDHYGEPTCTNPPEDGRDFGREKSAQAPSLSVPVSERERGPVPNQNVASAQSPVRRTSSALWVGGHRVIFPSVHSFLPLRSRIHLSLCLVCSRISGGRQQCWYQTRLSCVCVCVCVFAYGITYARQTGVHIGVWANVFSRPYRSLCVLARVPTSYPSLLGALMRRRANGVLKMKA